jgi:hypothetical protein
MKGYDGESSFFSFAGENPNSLRKTQQLHRKAPADIFELED